MNSVHVVLIVIWEAVKNMGGPLVKIILWADFHSFDFKRSFATLILLFFASHVLIEYIERVLIQVSWFQSEAVSILDTHLFIALAKLDRVS